MKEWVDYTNLALGIHRLANCEGGCYQHWMLVCQLAVVVPAKRHRILVPRKQ